MRLRVHQIDGTDGNPGDVPTVDPTGTFLIFAAPTVTEPLFADDGSGALVLDSGDGWVYPD